MAYTVPDTTNVQAGPREGTDESGKVLGLIRGFGNTAGSSGVSRPPLPMSGFFHYFMKTPCCTDRADWRRVVRHGEIKIEQELQCLGTATQGRVVRHGEIKIEQLQDGADQPL